MFDIIPSFIVLDQIRPLICATPEALKQIQQHAKVMRAAITETNPVHSTILEAMANKLDKDVKLELALRN